MWHRNIKVTSDVSETNCDQVLYFKWRLSLQTQCVNQSTKCIVCKRQARDHSITTT